MSIEITSIQEQPFNTGLPTIKVIGVGGGGGNVVNRMIEDRVIGVDYIAVNTDVMVLNSSKAAIKIPIGTTTSKGLGAGMKPEVGKLAAEEDQEAIKEMLKNTDMVFIAAGMGGGTGTGAAPVIAEIAKESKILTVGVVTTPFKFEGRKRATLAEQGIHELKKHVDTLMVIPNNKLLEIVSQNTTMNEAFAMVDDVLKQAISGITNLINLEGMINLDFADVRTVMANKGRAIMGTGIANGENRGLEASKKAIASPLLSDKQISGATGVIINIVADCNFSLKDAESSAEYIESSADQDADVIFGFVQDPSKQDEVAITVIATGFEKNQEISTKGNKLRVIDSLRNQAPEKEEQSLSELSHSPQEKELEFEESIIKEDILELDSKYIQPVESELHYPEHLSQQEQTSPSSKDHIDYDIPTFIRKSRNLK